MAYSMGKKKRKPYRLSKKSNKGQNENTGIHSNPAGTGKEIEGNAHTYRDPKSSYPKELNYTGKKGTMTY